MNAIRIEILNPKALQLIKDLQELDLIKISDEPSSLLGSYLDKMRNTPEAAPDLEEITRLVQESRTERYGKE